MQSNLSQVLKGVSTGYMGAGVLLVTLGRKIPVVPSHHPTMGKGRGAVRSGTGKHV